MSCTRVSVALLLVRSPRRPCERLVFSTRVRYREPTGCKAFLGRWKACTCHANAPFEFSSTVQPSRPDPDAFAPAGHRLEIPCDVFGGPAREMIFRPLVSRPMDVRTTQRHPSQEIRLSDSGVFAWFDPVVRPTTGMCIRLRPCVRHRFARARRSRRLRRRWHDSSCRRERRAWSIRSSRPWHRSPIP